MMKSSISFLIIIFLLLPVICRAQELNNKILLTVGGKEIQAGEFIRMYKKTLQPGSDSDIDGYLDDFVVFKLKVTDAIHEGLDTTKEFINELNGYRNQLAQNYLTDADTKEKLIRKSFERLSTEINAWHILIALPEDASPEDTLKAWDKAIDIRERIIKGESFEQVARGTSDDQSVKFNGGNLGYFTAFQMIMPFEDAAYALKKGQISMPVRTPYGYHIIMVTDKRPSKGKIKVAHIMKNAPPGTDEEGIRQAKEEINNIYKLLLEGQAFSELAKKYSDHKESAVNGGELAWFGTGEIISDFAEAAYSLADTGNFTEPIRTIYGWHIIKLLDKQEPRTYEEVRNYLESKINQSSINSISKKSMVEKLKKEYNFRINQEAYDWFLNNTDTLIIKGLKKYDRTGMPSGNIYSFSDQYMTTYDFASYIEKRGFAIITNDSFKFINGSINARVSDHILNYENSVLEKKYPEFRYLMNEFHDGILLFEVSGRNVWNRVTEDSAGLQQFYEDHKNSYLTRRGIEGTIYTLRSSKGEKKLLSAYRRYSRKPDIDDRLIGKFNTHNDTLLLIDKGIWLAGDNSDLDELKWKEGYQSFSSNGFPSIIKIERVIEPVPQSFSEIQGEMITGYQEYLESEWVKQLKGKYNVKIDSITFEEVKNSLKQ